jgi:lysophospholipase L1-like esterase
MGASGKIEDGVHFNAMGKKRLAEHKAEFIKNLLTL